MDNSVLFYFLSPKVNEAKEDLVIRIFTTINLGLIMRYISKRN